MFETADREVDRRCDAFNDVVTLGARSNFQDQLWRFPSTKKCPLSDCDLMCSSRIEAFKHFKFYHATTTMMCTVCNILFSVTNPLKLLIHYQIQHPNDRPPQLKLEEDVINLDSDDHDEGELLPIQSYENVDNPVQNYEKNAVEDDFYVSEAPERKTTRVLRKKDECNNNNPKLTKTIEEADDLITLTGCNITTKWRFPKDSKTCPQRNCRLNSKNRASAIAHYRKIHSINAILCSICDKPIRVANTNSGSHYSRHYKRQHPNKKIPFKFGDTSKPEINKSVAPTTKKVQLHRAKKSIQQIDRISIGDHDNDEDEEDDDCVKLTGCGRIMYWQWPKNGEYMKQCPVKNCRMQFGVRADVIVHYRRRHAKNSLLCEICNKPLVTYTIKDLTRHYKSIHRGKRIPSFDEVGNKSEKEQQPTAQSCPQNRVNRGPKDEEDDLITLTGGDQITQWKFPQRLRKCPVVICSKMFGDRSDTIRHYKKCHSNNYAHCSMKKCEKPVYARNMSDYNLHFRRQHPNFKLNSDITSESFEKNTTKKTKNCETSGLKNTKNRCEICKKKLSSIQNKIRHVKEVHESKRICCSLKNCNYSHKRMSDLRLHWNKNHADLPFPEIREESDFTYATKTSESDQNVSSFRMNRIVYES